MGSLLLRRTAPPTRQEPSNEIRFVPARWLVLALGLVLKRGALGKVGIATLLWSFAPRKLKLVVGGLAAWMAIIMLGSIAAIALLFLQLG
jgi:hypothetical protein